VSSDPDTSVIVRYWLDKAHESLASARSEAVASRSSFAINRCYYAAFYAASAVLLSEGRRFRKHSGVRAGVHQHLIRTGRLDEAWGRFYDQLSGDRQEADYVELAAFDPESVDETVRKAAELVGCLEALTELPRE